MKRRKTDKVDAVLDLCIQDSQMQDPLLRYRILQAWRKVVPSEVADYTEPLYVKEKILWVRIHTPALRTQLSLKRLQLIEQLNQAVKHKVISNIKFI